MRGITLLSKGMWGWLLLAAAPAIAQVNGYLVDPKGKPVIGAAVFINHSLVRSETDDFGQFALLDCPTGIQEIVAYKEGFELYRAPMRIQRGKSYSLNIQFVAVQKKQRGKTTPESKEAFSQALLGSEGLLFYNQEINVDVEMADGKFRVYSGPVVVEYPNAGYRIIAYFNPTTFQDVNEAAYSFLEYQGSNVKQNMAVERTRINLYKGSLRHWLTSTINGNSAEEGFSLTDGAGNALPPFQAVASATQGYSRITSETPVTVHYKDQAPSQITWLGPVDVSASGTMINPRQIKVTGAMSKPDLTYQLPIDYRPIQDIEKTFSEALRYFYEKVYVQTDKPYYYPGEPLWFKAYINYYNRTWQDSLSHVLYVELLTADKDVKLQRMFRIDDGRSHGDLLIPDSIAEGTYYLRAYTTLRRNFGDSGLFTRPLRVLNILDKADPTHLRPIPEKSSLAITPGEETYHTRDKVTLDIRLGEGLTPGIANLSVAVTDVSQVIAVPDPINILDTYPINPDEIPLINDLVHRIESGVSFYAQFLNNKGAPEKTQLNFIKWKTGDVLYAETGDDGMFWQTGLQFTDSAMFSYKSDKAKGKPYGKVMILPREIPPVQSPYEPDWQIIKAGTVQRIFSEYEIPKDSKLLESIEVTASRLESEAQARAKRRPYGRADYVITREKLNVGTGNLLYALVGKVPGLVVSPTQNTVFFARAQANSLTDSGQPMVTVNDVPMAGDAATVLQTIDYNTIESIEFTNRLNSLYGEQGRNGVIAVYTRAGPTGVDNTNPNFQMIKLPGYSKIRNFQAPNYESPGENATQTDYRATLYWNPDVTMDKNGFASVSFYASDLSGQYRVIVEGVTADGNPVRGETLITIKEK